MLDKYREKDVIMIPAYNEMFNIVRTIRLIRSTKIDAEIIVVNDASKDFTASIARLMNVKVINVDINKGKANAFFLGVEFAINIGARSLTTIDADMIKVGRIGLLKLIAATLNHDSITPKMTVSSVTEKGHSPTIELSGIRSFNKEAIERLSRFDRKEYVKGYALERFLNDFFRENTTFIKLHSEFLAAKPYRDIDRGTRQMNDIALYDAKFKRKIEEHKKM